MEPLRSWHQEKRKEAGWEWEAGPDVGGRAVGVHAVLSHVYWTSGLRERLSHPKIQSSGILQDFPFSLAFLV